MFNQTIVFNCTKCNIMANTAIHLFEKYVHKNIYVISYNPGYNTKHILHEELTNKLIRRLFPVLDSLPYSRINKEFHLCIHCYNLLSYISASDNHSYIITYGKLKNQPLVDYTLSHATVSGLSHDIHSKYFNICSKAITFETLQQLKEIHNDKFVIHLDKLSTEELVEIKSGFGFLEQR